MATLGAGAIAVRMVGEGPQFLVVTAKGNPDHWLFPKGHIDPGEDADETAIRELREEAGVDGELVRQIGSTGYTHDGEEMEVTYFLVQAVSEAANSEGRTCRWLAYAEARQQLSFENLRTLLDSAARALGIAES